MSGPAPLKVIAISGGPYRPSRTQVLAQEILNELGQQLHITGQIIELADIARPLGSALVRSELPEQVELQLQAIESADLLIIASPVYRGSYPGLFKHLFDLLGQDALVSTPVLLAATGGSPLHALVIDHQLRPLFSFFQSITLPIGVYATESDFHDYRISSDALRTRIRLAVERAVPFFARQAQLLRKIA